MALRDFTTVGYLPMLTVSNAEMRGLQELPNADKDLLLPYFQLRPWGVSNELRSTINRITEAYGERPFIADICAPAPPGGPTRPVHDELQRLREPHNGYAAWCDYLESHAFMIPTLQLRDISQLAPQIDRLYGLGRGLAVYLPQGVHGQLQNLMELISAGTRQGQDVVAIIDLGQRGQELLLTQAITTGLVRTITNAAPQIAVAISASSFPQDFVDRSSQEIFERRHYQGVRGQFPGSPLIYSDRGSARAERQMGGGGAPAPRVDLAKGESWSFFRDGSGGPRPSGYVTQSSAAMASDAWDRHLRIWGYQMIERTAGGDVTAIRSPVSSAAVRINIHLHHQLFYDHPLDMYDTDDEWTD
ncbi:beta family protein [Brevundimonas sp. NPDC055814]